MHFAFCILHFFSFQSVSRFHVDIGPTYKTGKTEACSHCNRTFACFLSNSKREAGPLVSCPHCLAATPIGRVLELKSHVYVNCKECHALTSVYPEDLAFAFLKCSFCSASFSKDTYPFAFDNLFYAPSTAAKRKRTKRKLKSYSASAFT